MLKGNAGFDTDCYKLDIAKLPSDSGKQSLMVYIKMEEKSISYLEYNGQFYVFIYEVI